MSSALSKCEMLFGAYLSLRSSLGFRCNRPIVLFFILSGFHTEGITPNSLEKRAIDRRNSVEQFFFNSCESLFGRAMLDYVCVFAQGDLALNTNTHYPKKVYNFVRSVRNIAKNIDLSIMALFRLDSSGFCMILYTLIIATGSARIIC